MKAVQNGIWLGIFSTSAMTLGFLYFYKKLDLSERSSLPPGSRFSELTARVGIDQTLSQTGRTNAALASHFGYGIFFAVLYGLLPTRVEDRPLQTGMVYGLGRQVILELFRPFNCGRRQKIFR